MTEFVLSKFVSPEDMYAAMQARIDKREQELCSWQITAENKDREIAQLKAELEAVGAGGVQALRLSPEARAKFYEVAHAEFEPNEKLKAAAQRHKATQPAAVPTEGEIVITRSQAGQIVAVTRQDEEGRILSVLAESTQSAAVAVGDVTISGALFDFAGYLTTLPKDKAFTVGAAHEASSMVEALRAWAMKRSLNIDDANVSGWRAALATTPDVAAIPRAKASVTLDYKQATRCGLALRQAPQSSPRDSAGSS